MKMEANQNVYSDVVMVCVRVCRYRPLRNKYAGGGPPGLKKLSKELLGIDIQKGEHSSVTDAQATMAVYLKVGYCGVTALSGGQAL